MAFLKLYYLDKLSNTKQQLQPLFPKLPFHSIPALRVAENKRQLEQYVLGHYFSIHFLILNGCSCSF